MTAFDPTSSKYQVSPCFPPDKESTWHFPAERDGWMLAHNAIRGEVVLLKEAIQILKKRKSYEIWEVRALQQMWHSHFEHVEAHHHNEDDKFQPLFEERFHFPEQKDTPDHKVIVDHLEKLSRLFGNLKANEGRKQIQNLLDALISYEKDLLPHLLWEEKMLIPLMRAYFTAAEMSQIVQEITKTDPPQSMGSFIHFHGAEYFRNVFMKQENIPPFVWEAAFQGLHKTFYESFLAPFEALKTDNASAHQSKRMLVLSRIFRRGNGIRSSARMLP